MSHSRSNSSPLFQFNKSTTTTSSSFNSSSAASPLKVTPVPSASLESSDPDSPITPKASTSPSSTPHAFTIKNLTQTEAIPSSSTTSSMHGANTPRHLERSQSQPDAYSTPEPSNNTNSTAVGPQTNNANRPGPSSAAFQRSVSLLLQKKRRLASASFPLALPEDGFFFESAIPHRRARSRHSTLKDDESFLANNSSSIRDIPFFDSPTKDNNKNESPLSITPPPPTSFTSQSHDLPSSSSHDRLVLSPSSDELPLLSTVVMTPSTEEWRILGLDSSHDDDEDDSDNNNDNANNLSASVQSLDLSSSTKTITPSDNVISNNNESNNNSSTKAPPSPSSLSTHSSTSSSSSSSSSYTSRQGLFDPNVIPDPKLYSLVSRAYNIDSFVIQGDAGKGTYGLVRSARPQGPNSQPVGPELIIKYIIKQRILADCWKRHRVLGPIPVEIHVLDYLRRVTTPASSPDDPSVAGHPNICGMYDVFEDPEHYFLVMPKFGNGRDLFDYVDSCPTGLPIQEILNITRQITSAVAFLHQHNIVHRDIKDENVILDGKGKAQLIDFGSAAYIKEGKKFDTFSGTLDFASPEVLRGERYGGKQADIWALGVLFYVVLCGECPFWNSEEALSGLSLGSRPYSALINKISEAPPSKLNLVSDFVDLTMRCLELEVDARPTADQILAHRFFQHNMDNNSKDNFITNNAQHVDPNLVNGWTGKFGWNNPQSPQNVLFSDIQTLSSTAAPTPTTTTSPTTTGHSTSSSTISYKPNVVNETPSATTSNTTSSSTSSASQSSTTTRTSSSSSYASQSACYVKA